MIKVDLETTEPGATIVQDIKDHLGRLLVKAPRVIDPDLKRALLLRGVSEILIQESSGQEKEEWNELMEKEKEEIRRRFSRLPDTSQTRRIVELFIKAFEDYTEESEKGAFSS